MCADSPARLRRLIDRPPHEGMAKDEFVAQPACVHERQIVKLIQSLQHLRLAQLGDFGDGRGLEDAADHRCSLDNRSCLVREQVQLPGDRRDDRGRDRNAGAVSPVVADLDPAGGSSELLKVERVSAAFGNHLLARRAVEAGSDELTARLGWQGLEVDDRPWALVRLVSPRRVEGLAERGARLPGPVGQDEEHRPPRRPSEQVGKELDRRRVSPMQVVEAQNHRARDGQPFEHRAHRLEGSKAIRNELGGCGLLEPVERREDRSDLPCHGIVEPLPPTRSEFRQVIVEGVDEYSEGIVALEFRRTPVEQEVAAIEPGCPELRQQARLSDARLPDDVQDA